MTVQISYFSATGSEMANLGIALSEISDSYSIRLDGKTRIQLPDDYLIDEFVSKALESDMIYISLHGGETSCPPFVPLMDALEKRRKAGERVPYVHIQGEMESLALCQKFGTEAGSENWENIIKYSTSGGVANLKNMLLLMLAIVTKEDIPRDDPIPTVQHGIYHPDLKEVPDPEEYKKKLVQEGKPVVGIWFYQTYWINSNLDHIDAFIREIEKQGASALALFHNRYGSKDLGNLGVDELVDRYFMLDGKPVIDLLINAMHFSLNLVRPEYKGLLKSLGVPIFQGMISSNTRKDWEESYQGISTMDVVFSAAQPEFDGVMININSGTKETDITEPLTGALIARYKPIPERVEKFISHALNWVALAKKKNEEKKVAIIFHHNPPRNDRIGCAVGLDTFASVKLLIDRMKDEGYVIDRTYDDGDHMAGELLDRMTYDRSPGKI